MPARIRTRGVKLGLAVLALVLAVLQRPGWSSSDTKIDLHTDPIRFLGEIAHLWTPSSGLGGVESAQYAGYLFPMGPFFALGHVLGLGDWLVDRLWLGLLLAVGCWGAARLVEALGVARTPVGVAAAGLLYLLNPYVVVFANRTTITLLAYALLPWLVLVAWWGLRQPTRWRLAAVFALLVTASGGGVNAAVVALALLAPLVVVLYDALLGAATWRAVWQFGWRAALATLVASLWWVAPAAAQASYGVDFLGFTEPAGAIWATTSLSESFRAMGYWISYIGVGFNGVVRPYFSDAGTLLFNHLVVTATFLVPGVALLGFAWSRRRRYAAYFLALVLLGTLVMAIGFPEGTPLRKGATFAYNNFQGLRFLRTTYKTAPLVVLGVAGLGAAAAELAAERLRGAARAAAAVAGCAVVALASWPFVSGEAVDQQVSWKSVPAGWNAAARDLDHTLGDDGRAAVLPGQLYAFYRWGGTIDPILPALTDKPVAVRNAVPYGDLRGTDLLWTTDALVQQERLLPGQLKPLLGLMSVRSVVAATDDDVHRSGAIDPAASVRALAAQGLTAGRVYGDGVRSFGVGAGRPLVRVERRLPSAADRAASGPGATAATGSRVGAEATAATGSHIGAVPSVVVDGGADGLADLAGMGALPGSDAFGYAGDLQPQQVRAVARRGGTVVVSDSNRRRVFVVSRMQQNTGWTLGAGDKISEDAATLDPFAARGSDAQTVAVFHGAKSISAPFSPGYSQFPEHRPFAAFDGNPRTAWLADPALVPERHTLTTTFTRPRDVGSIRILPRDEAGARTVALVVNGRRFDVGEGWQTLELGLKRVGALSLRPVAAKTGSAAAGGLAEVRVPGLKVSESLRPPLLAESALRGVDLSRSTLRYAFNRASGDNPWRRSSSVGVRVRGPEKNPARLEQQRVDGAGDEEVGIDRVVDPPAARTYNVRAWVSVTPEASDSAIDRLVGVDGSASRGGSQVRAKSSAAAPASADSARGAPIAADSSGRFEGRPGFRASSALDGDPRTAWIAPPSPSWRGVTRSSRRASPWIRITTRRPVAVRELRIAPALQRRGADRIPTAVPTRVALESPGGSTGPLVVSGGRVVLPHPIRTKSFTLRVLDASPAGAPVGIGELRVPGLEPMRVPGHGRIRGCGGVRLMAGGRPVGLRVDGDIRQLDAGEPMRATGCSTLSLGAGTQRIQIPPRTLRPDKVLLDSPAPEPIAQTATTPGAVSDPGQPGRGQRDNVKLDVRAPSWLVLGESYDRGWRGWCNGRALGESVPLDGYANAWPIEPGCTTARFAFAPQKPVHLIQILSALGCLLLLLMALGLPQRLRRRGDIEWSRERAVAPVGDHSAHREWADRPPARVALPRAAAIGLVAGAVLAFCFSLRSGLLIAPAVALVLWRGIAAKPLAIAGGLLLAIAVPLEYIAVPAKDLGGYNPSFAGDQVGGHWIAVAAWVLLALALCRTVSTARSRRDAPSRVPGDAAS